MSGRAALIAAAGVLACIATAQASEPLRLSADQMDRVTAGKATGAGVGVNANATGTTAKTKTKVKSRAKGNQDAQAAYAAGSGVATAVNGDSSVDTEVLVAGDRTYAREVGSTVSTGGVSVSIGIGVGIGLSGPF